MFLLLLLVLLLDVSSNINSPVVPLPPAASITNANGAASYSNRK